MSQTILVVDDNEPARLALSRTLRAEGYRVAIGANSVEAMTYLSNNPPPALIMLDLVMPGGDGWGFRRDQLANARLASIPVVVMSGLDATPGMQGAAAFLQKPFDRERLLAIVRDAMAKANERERAPGATIDAR